MLSKKAHARILSIDDSLAKSSPGFAGLFLSKDIPGVNHTGPIIHDEEFFASNIVTCVGQVSCILYILSLISILVYVNLITRLIHQLHLFLIDRSLELLLLILMIMQKLLPTKYISSIVSSQQFYV